MTIRASTRPEALAGVAGGVLEEPLGAIARGPRGDRGDGPGHLPVASGEVGGELLLALGEAAELVVGECRERLDALASRDPVEAVGEASDRAPDCADEDAPGGKADERRDDERGEDELERDRAAARGEKGRKGKDRQDGGGDRDERDSGPQAAPAHPGAASSR